MNFKDPHPIPPAFVELSVEQQLEAEIIRSAELNVLIEALDVIAPESLGLSPDGVRLYKQLMTQIGYQEFVYLPTKRGGAPQTVLGIDNSPPTGSFAYTEKKAIQRACLDTASSRILRPAIAFMAEKRKQTQFNIFDLPQLKQDIIAAAQKQQKLRSDLLLAGIERLGLLQQAAQIKAGPQLADELEETLLRLKLIGEKSSILIQMLNREFCFRTDHSIKALKQVDGFLDTAIATYQK